MTDYIKRWEEIEARLRAAYSLMRADDPAAAEAIASDLQETLDANELELALDAILSGARKATATLRRRVWEELLTAAMLMSLEPQFRAITEQIDNLEPHVFGPHADPPRIYCDFNGSIERDIYSLDGVGTALDFARLGFVPRPKQQLTLYDADEEEDGTPSWLLADAQIVELESWGLVAKVVPKSYRWERRQV